MLLDLRFLYESQGTVVISTDGLSTGVATDNWLAVAIWNVLGSSAGLSPVDGTAAAIWNVLGQSAGLGAALADANAIWAVTWGADASGVGTCTGLVVSFGTSLGNCTGLAVVDGISGKIAGVVWNSDGAGEGLWQIMDSAAAAGTTHFLTILGAGG